MSEFPPILMSLFYRLEGVGLSSSGTSTPLALESSDGVVNGPGREFKIDSFLRRCNRMIHSALGSCSWIGWNLDRSAHKEFHPVLGLNALLLEVKWHWLGLRLRFTALIRWDGTKPAVEVSSAVAVDWLLEWRGDRPRHWRLGNITKI